MKPARRAPLALALVCLLLAATASQAVIIYFKDGSKEIIADRYRVEGNRVIAVLTNGQETAIPLDAVDLEKTEKMGKVVKGSAIVVRAARSTRRSPKQARSVADLMRERSTLPTPVPVAERVSLQPALHAGGQRRLPRLVATPAHPAGARRAGRVADEESRLERCDGLPGHAGEPRADRHRDRDQRRGVRRAPVERGDAARAPARLARGAGARARDGDRRAIARRQFVLTPEQAQQLAGGATTPAQYFVANVLF